MESGSDAHYSSRRQGKGDRGPRCTGEGFRRPELLRFSGRSRTACAQSVGWYRWVTPDFAGRRLPLYRRDQSSATPPLPWWKVVTRHVSAGGSFHPRSSISAEHRATKERRASADACRFLHLTLQTRAWSCLGPSARGLTAQCPPLGRTPNAGKADFIALFRK